LYFAWLQSDIERGRELSNAGDRDYVAKHMVVFPHSPDHLIGLLGAVPKDLETMARRHLRQFQGCPNDVTHDRRHRVIDDLLTKEREEYRKRL
jgi:hypothetical protein